MVIGIQSTDDRNNLGCDSLWKGEVIFAVTILKDHEKYSDSECVHAVPLVVNCCSSSPNDVEILKV